MRGVGYVVKYVLPAVATVFLTVGCQTTPTPNATREHNADVIDRWASDQELRGKKREGKLWVEYRAKREQGSEDGSEESSRE